MGSAAQEPAPHRFVPLLGRARGPAQDRSEDARRLAIACARTTPAFLDGFVNSEEYLIGDLPRRDVYYPGNSIVFIARRGWCCLQLESRDFQSMRFGVIEIVLFVIEAMLASFRTTRRFLRHSSYYGEKARVGATASLASNVKPKEITAACSALAVFVARARLNSPMDDMATLLRAHLKTHTGIAAIDRMRLLTQHDELVQKTNDTLDSYNALLDLVSEQWSRQNLRLTRKAVLVAIVSVLVAVGSVVWAMVRG